MSAATLGNGQTAQYGGRRTQLRMENIEEPILSFCMFVAILLYR